MLIRRSSALLILVASLLMTMSLAGPVARATAPTTVSERIATRVDEAAARVGLPGFSVAVTRGDTTLYRGGRGRDPQGNPMTADSPQRLASLSKSFTAVAVMRLVERGRIALDVPVVDQLPGFTPADPRARAITVRHLLTQTSGLTDPGIDVARVDEARSPTEVVEQVALAHLTTAPGTRFSYCNANYEVAARLLEVTGGAPFAEVMRREVREGNRQRSPARRRRPRPGHRPRDRRRGHPADHQPARHPGGRRSRHRADMGAVLSSEQDEAASRTVALDAASHDRPRFALMASVSRFDALSTLISAGWLPHDGAFRLERSLV